MISISKPEMIQIGNKARLCARIAISEEIYRKWIAEIGSMGRYQGYEKMYRYNAGEFELWYEVDREYEEYLCYERSDAFVLAVLYFAMVTGNDIQCEGAVSNELYHNLNTYIIPLHCNSRTGYRRIRILAETDASRLKTKGDNGTGLSCGVDSFDCIFAYMGKNMDDAHRLSWGTVFHAGAFYGMSDMKKCIRQEMTVDEWDEKARLQFRQQCVKSEEIAKQLGLRFLAVDSNISNLYQGAFLQSHAYRNCSVVLALQKLFGHYYYASAGEPMKDYMGLDKDASDNVQFFNTEATRFYLGGIEKNRIEKLLHISEYEIARKNLLVCSEGGYNCGKCGKCNRTLIILDMLGKIDVFRENFRDLSSYQQKKWRKYVWILDKKESDQYAKDIFGYMQRNNIKIPAIARLYHYMLPVRRMVKQFVKQ